MCILGRPHLVIVPPMFTGKVCGFFLVGGRGGDL